MIANDANQGRLNLLTSNVKLLSSIFFPMVLRLTFGMLNYENKDLPIFKSYHKILLCMHC